MTTPFQNSDRNEYLNKIDKKMFVLLFLSF